MAISTELKDSLAKEAGRIEEDCEYSAKSHFNAADIWSTRALKLGVPATIIAALSGLSFNYCPTIATSLAIAASILTGLITFLRPDDKASTHKSTGDIYLSIRNQARVFREIELNVLGSNDAGYKALKNLADKRDEQNRISPSIPRKAFETARTGIEQGETEFKVDKN
jgi:hypothetical protein